MNADMYNASRIVRDEHPFSPSSLPASKDCPPRFRAYVITAPLDKPRALSHLYPELSIILSRPTSRFRPTTFPSPAPSASPTLAGEELGFLGSGYISGSFSADGIPDEVLASLGQDGAVRQVRV